MDINLRRQSFVFQFLALLILTLVAPVAIAVNYVVITQDTDGATWEVDQDNIRIEGRFVRFWQKRTLKTPQISGPNGQYAASRLISSAVDCERQTDAMTSWADRDSNERIIVSSTVQSWVEKETMPGSVGFAINEFACAVVGKTFGPRDESNLTFFSSKYWEYVDRNAQGAVYVPSEREPINGIGHTLVRIDLSKPIVLVGRTITRQVFGEAFDCQNTKSQSEKYWFYNLGGKEVFSSDWKSDFQLPGGGSSIGIAMNVACSTSKRSAKSREATSSTSYSVGTGWISDTGYVVSANHVVDGRSKITIVLPNKERVAAQVVSVDSVNDIVILYIPYSDNKPTQMLGLPLARGTVGLGARVFTLGYPLKDILGSSLKLTAGEVSATSGIRDDPRIFQISVPVQAGNSGGPLLNMKGEVVGLVSAKLSAVQVLRETGDLPQNVNYAIKARYIEGLLMDLPKKSVSTIRIPPQASLEEIASQVRDLVVMVIAE